MQILARFLGEISLSATTQFYQSRVWMFLKEHKFACAPKNNYSRASVFICIFRVKCARPFVVVQTLFTFVNFMSHAPPAPLWIISLAERACALIIQRCIRFYWAFIDLISRLSRRATFHFKMHSAPDLFLMQFFKRHFWYYLRFGAHHARAH